MKLARLDRAALTLALAALLAACGPRDGAPPPGALQLRFEDREEPSAFSRAGTGRRADGDESGAWAVIPDLPRPERAVVHNLATGAAVEVALYRARHGTASTDIRISAEAAAALGIADAPVPVEVIALRREAELAADADRF